MAFHADPDSISVITNKMGTVVERLSDLRRNLVIWCHCGVTIQQQGEIGSGASRANRPAEDVVHKQKAQDFYASVRCGLLHESRTKNGWRIEAGRTPGIAIDTYAKIIYRSRMRDLFDRFTASYGAKLETERDLQATFLRKFDSLCAG